MNLVDFLFYGIAWLVSIVCGFIVYRAVVVFIESLIRTNLAGYVTHEDVSKMFDSHKLVYSHIPNCPEENYIKNKAGGKRASSK